MKIKTFKTLDEQIEILEKKGLIIEDVDSAKNILLRENYFFLNGYRHLFVDDDKNFINGATFRELHAMFYFDRQIRNIIFKNILVLENNLKSITSYVLSKSHGFKEINYLNPRNLSNDPKKIRQISDLIRKMKRQISVNGKQHTATAHYIINYGYIPLWVAVKVLSFGIIGELYTVLQYEDQKHIADVFNTDVNRMIEYLPILANYRNLCAHEDICYTNKTLKVIEDTEYHHLLYIPKSDNMYIYGKNDLFSLVIILKQMLDEANFNLFINEISYEIDVLAGKLKSINIEKVLHEMGFPNNYKEIARMK